TLPLDDPAARHAPQARQHQILANGAIWQDAFLLAIRRQKSDARGKGVSRIAGFIGVAAKFNGAAKHRMQANEGAADFFSPAANDAVKTDDLAIPDLERNAMTIGGSQFRYFE